MCGLSSRARAMAIRCFCPPLKGRSSLPHPGIVPIWKFHDKVVGRGGFCRCDDIILGGIRFSESNIVPDRPKEKSGFLQYDADLGSQGLERQIPQVMTIDRDTAFSWVIKPGKQVDDRCLARSGSSQQGNHLSREGIEAYIFQHRVAGSKITETDILEFDMSFHFRKHNRFWFIGNVALGIQDFKDARCRSGSLAELGDDEAKLGYWEEHKN